MYGKPWDTHRLSSSVYSLIPNNLVQEEHIYGININTNGKKYTNKVMEEKGCKDCCITKII